jgi:carbon monoxide dehydrogenase subunit G
MSTTGAGHVTFRTGENHGKNGQARTMNRFGATTESEAVVAADRMQIWAALTDPVLLPRLTPLLRSIDADGDVWRWHLMRIAALGVSISPTFTELMQFDHGRRIDYTHTPPAGSTERAGADGSYRLEDVAGGTHLAISLTLHVELPLTRLAGPAVDAVIKATMQRTGERFSRNLLSHLGVAGP